MSRKVRNAGFRALSAALGARQCAPSPAPLPSRHSADEVHTVGPPMTRRTLETRRVPGTAPTPSASRTAGGRDGIRFQESWGHAFFLLLSLPGNPAGHREDRASLQISKDKSAQQSCYFCKAEEGLNPALRDPEGGACGYKSESTSEITDHPVQAERCNCSPLLPNVTNEQYERERGMVSCETISSRGMK